MYSKKEQLKNNKEKKLRKRKCKNCRKWFDPEREKQDCCSVDCSILYARVKIKKQQYQTKRAFRQKEKSRLKEKAQTVFNKFIRFRDKNLPCISCGHTSGRQFHAGHFKSAGQNPQLRFNELNVHKQCSICNNYKSGNLDNYRMNLIKRIGIENVEALESDKSVKKYTEDDYKNIIVKYMEKLKV